MLITALLAGSCGSSKTTAESNLQAQEQKEATTTSKTNSITEGLINDYIERFFTDASTSDTDVTIYDTSRPTDSVTGRPPVKATISHKKHNRITAHSTEHNDSKMLENVTHETDSAGTAATLTITDTSHQTKKDQPAFVSLTRLCGLLLFVGLCVYVINRLIKKK